MRARQLEVFTAVMRSGTVTAAAHMLNISQPALSQILLHTEDELGFALFDRVKGRLQPTPEALELFPEAERLFAGLEGLRRKTADLRLGRAGLVRAGASTPPAMALLPQAMAAFRSEHPHVVLRSHIAPIATLINMLRDGDVAMAMALDDRMPPDIEIEPLSRAGFCCLVPEAHKLAQRERIGFADLQEETVISYRGNTRPADELAKAARIAGAEFSVQIEIDVSISAVGFVAANLGIAVVDALLPWSQFRGIVARPVLDGPMMPLSLLTPTARSLSRAEDVLRDHIRKVSAEWQARI